ncbi:hypothetical protein HYW17_02050 [Candidatus Uhrbacteria bacterium]|nr:hypothetical protein [Candidatus Uhrbacteria bacterium]
MRFFNVLCAIFTVFLTVSKADARALPAMGSDVCQGALPLAKLVAVKVSKNKADRRACPAGSRSPYLCALHTAGLAHRSLGHAMRETIADLGDGTCGRVNLRGALLWTADGKSFTGDKFLDPRRALPATNLRFGAWRTDVLYLTPVAGEEQLAQVTSERNECRAELKTAEQCGNLGTLYNAVTKHCQTCGTVSAAAVQECPACPKRPAPRVQQALADLQACEGDRDTLKRHVVDLQPLVNSGGRAKRCAEQGELYNAATNACVPSAGLSPGPADAAAERLAFLEERVRLLQQALVSANSCIQQRRVYMYIPDARDPRGWRTECQAMAAP